MLKKHVKRAAVLMIITILVLTVSVLIINKYVEEKGKKYILESNDVPKADAILVLGAYVTPDGTVSYMLNDRLTVAYELYQMGKAEKKRFLMEKGISDQDIFMDHAGFSTYESLYRARDIFQVKRVIIVTQEYHLKRAVFIGRELGIEAYGVVSDKRNYVYMDYYKIREIAARNKDFLTAKIIKPKPTFLGDDIPVFGDGRRTNDK